jgi:hypothetical protein
MYDLPLILRFFLYFAVQIILAYFIADIAKVIYNEARTEVLRHLSIVTLAGVASWISFFNILWIVVMITPTIDEIFLIIILSILSLVMQIAVTGLKKIEQEVGLLLVKLYFLGYLFVGTTLILSIWSRV